MQTIAFFVSTSLSLSVSGVFSVHFTSQLLGFSLLPTVSPVPYLAETHFCSIFDEGLFINRPRLFPPVYSDNSGICSTTQLTCSCVAP